VGRNQGVSIVFIPDRHNPVLVHFLLIVQFQFATEVIAETKKHEPTETKREAAERRARQAKSSRGYLL